MQYQVVVGHVCQRAANITLLAVIAFLWAARESVHPSTTSRSPSGQYRHSFDDSQSRLRQLAG